MASLLTLSMVSCGDKDDDIPYEGVTLSEGKFIEIEDFGTDNTVNYKLHFKISLSSGQLVTEGLTSDLISDFMPDREMPTATAITDLGEVKGLYKIEEIPADKDFMTATGGYQTMCPIAEKHGYVIKVWGDGHLDVYQNDKLKDPAAHYVRLWVEEATDGGFSVRYEFPFIPED